MASYQELQQFIIAGQKDKVPGEVKTLLGSGKAAVEIINDGLVGGLAIVGNKWKLGEMYIPEVIASAHAMNKGMAILKPLIVGEAMSFSKGKFVISTVEGDIHSIGKNIVAMLVDSLGFEVLDLGVDIPADKFLEAVKQEQPKILGLSALMTTVPRMKDVIEALKKAGLRDKVRVLVGGAPLHQDIADSIGADGYAPDALSAVEKAKELIG